MSDKVDTLKSKVTGAKDSVAGATPDTQDVAHGARRAAGIAQENPLGLALGAVAVGFVVGLLIPSSRVEDEKIGPVADHVKQRAAETGQQALEHGRQVAQDVADKGREAVGQAVQETRETARQSAGEHGRQVADDACSAVQDTQQQVRSS